MEPFTEADIMLIEKEATRLSTKEIAFLLDRDVKEVAAFVDQWRKENGLVSTEIKKPAAPRQPRKKKEKQKKDPLIISRRIEQEQKQKRDRNNEPVYNTKVVDLSKLKEVRIDQRTCIYIKPDQDPQAAREAYLKKLQKHKSRMMAAS